METYKTKYATIWEDQNGIIHIVMKEKFVINEEDAKEHIATCLKIANNQRRKILYDISKISNLTNAGLKRFMDPQISSLTIATAVIVGLRSPLVSMAISFMLKLDREPFPIKIFTNEKEAMVWLEEFK